MTPRSLQVRFIVISCLYAASTGVFAATDVLALQSRGFSWLAISVVIGIGWIGGFLLEVPTGMLADRYGRRRAVVASSLIRAIGLVFWAVAGRLPVLLLGAFLTTLGELLYSGSLEAWMVDAALGQRSDFSATLAWGTMLSRGASLLSGVVGAYMLMRWYGVSSPFWVAATGFLVLAGLACLLMQEDVRHDPTAEEHEQTRRPALSPAVLILAGVAALTYLGLSGPQYQWQIAVRQLSSEATLGANLSLAWIGISGIMALGSVAGTWFSRLETPHLALAISVETGVNAIAIAVVGMRGDTFPVFVGFYLLHLVATAGDGPARSILANRLIKGTKRATALSAISAGEYLGALLGLLALDALASLHLGIPVSWSPPALAMLVAVPALALTAHVQCRPRTVARNSPAAFPPVER